jgi:broad specificity phosphatase PhoE
MLTNPLSLDLQEHIWRTYFSNIVLKEYNDLQQVDLLKLLEVLREITPEDWNHLDIKSLMRELKEEKQLRKHEEEKRRKEIQDDWDFFVSIYPQFPK